MQNVNSSRQKGAWNLGAHCHQGHMPKPQAVVEAHLRPPACQSHLPQPPTSRLPSAPASVAHLPCFFLRSFIHSLTHSLIYSLIHLFTHPLIYSLVHLLIHSFTYSLPTHPLTHVFTHSLTHYLVTHSLIHLFIHPVTHSSTHPLIHSPSHSSTPSLIHSLVQVMSTC